jgi:ABC-2 type transport system ATP-binding protein
MTILVSSHILAELSDYSTHMLILDNGHLVEHRAIREDDRDGAIASRFRLELAKPDQRLLAILAQEPGVSDIVGDEGGARFEFDGDREASWDLLRTLIEAGLPVCAFSPQRESLQDTYLRRLHNRDADAAQ